MRRKRPGRRPARRCRRGVSKVPSHTRVHGVADLDRPRTFGFRSVVNLVPTVDHIEVRFEVACGRAMHSVTIDDGVLVSHL
jgi:hypothetical protein